jgi:hypothetical protein
MLFTNLAVLNVHRRSYELPNLLIDNKEYTFDKRLRELRETKTPWINVKLTELEIILIERLISEYEQGGDEHVQP